MATSDTRLKSLLNLCNGSKIRLRQLLEYSYKKHPNQPQEWHLNAIERILKPKTEASEQTKAQLIELCHGNIQSADRLVQAERPTVYSEEMAWSRAYEKLMNERMNLYANISYNS